MTRPAPLDPTTHPPRTCADTHLHFLLEYCNGGELYALLNSQPKWVPSPRATRCLPCLHRRLPAARHTCLRSGAGGCWVWRPWPCRPERCDLRPTRRTPNRPRALACSKRLKESVVQFYASEVLLALQYLHLLGFVYR